MADNLPRITVVTPSFNQGRYLDQTIRSVLDQNYPNLEYIICDGGSTDDSVEVIKRYESKLAWWSSGKDRGQTDAINKGLTRATGELLTYINSDDTLEPGSLVTAARAFKDGHEWITGWAVFIEPDGSLWPQVPSRDINRLEWFRLNPICQQGTFWSARLTRELGLFRQDMHFAFDYEFWMRIFFKANVSPHLIGRCMGGYRLHDTSKTISQYEKFRVEFKALRAEYWHHLTAAEQSVAQRRRRMFESELSCTAGWKALKDGDIASARRRAKESLAYNKFSMNAWRLMYCAVRGH